MISRGIIARSQGCLKVKMRFVSYNFSSAVFIIAPGVIPAKAGIHTLDPSFRWDDNLKMHYELQQTNFKKR